MKFVRANPSTQQTETNLVVAPPTRQSVHIKMVYVSSDTELAVSILSSVTHAELFKLYVGARGGIVLPVEILGPTAQGLDYSTSGAGNVFLLVGYDLDRSN